jgi:putative flippase GtrA
MREAIAQLIRFGLVGTSNSLIDLALYIGLTRGSDFFARHFLLAALIAFLIAGLNSFYWNRRWTFKNGNGFVRDQVLRFYVAAGLALTVNEVLLWALVGAGLHDIAAKVIAGGSAGLVNFLLQKFWTFTAVIAPETVADGAKKSYTVNK